MLADCCPYRFWAILFQMGQVHNEKRGLENFDTHRTIAGKWDKGKRCITYFGSLSRCKTMKRLGVIAKNIIYNHKAGNIVESHDRLCPEVIRHISMQKNSTSKIYTEERKKQKGMNRDDLLR